MGKKRRTTSAPRAASEYVNTCSHCGGERIIAPASALLGAARRHPLLYSFAEPLEQMQRYYGVNGMVALCPDCFCITGQIHGAHAH